MKILEGKNIPIKSWCNNVEEGALEQAYNLASLPFIFKHVCLMPDTHQGYGMPIGGVIACNNVVIPNAVGVDIGAVDKETEVLTKNGWITIDKYNNEDVLVWDDYHQTSFFDKPLLYIVKPCENFTEYKNKYGLDQVLSDEHRMLVYEGYSKNKNSNVYFCRDFREKLLKLKKHDYYSIRTTFPTNEKGINFTDEQIAIRIMVSADGHIRKASNDYTDVELHFKKQRKIERSKELLNKSNIEFKEINNKNGTITIKFRLDWVCEKNLTDLYECNQHQAKIVFDEYLHWDGTIDKERDHRVYTSTDKSNADVIQYICSVNGIRAGIKKQNSKKENWNDWYNVYQTKNAYVGFSKPKKIKIPNGKKYCFVVETGYFIARRNGKIFITGNCGMCSVKTSLMIGDLDEDMLKKILSKIREVIPVGFNHHKEAQDEKLMPGMSIKIEDIINTLDVSHKENKPFADISIEKDFPIVSQEYTSALKQLGTLGGGNHFIEIQKDEENNIWIMLHSGSRNLGYKVAKHYNELAQALCLRWHSNIPKFTGEDGLAFLPIETEEAQSYIKEMQYCVDFAFANRTLMMTRILEILNHKFPHLKYMSDNKNSVEGMINIAHNYAKLENHFDRNVWVHRKGATSATDGEIGIIPGSQGTSSYIVKGKGNRESFMSCSHGAGRKMSRTKAREELDLAGEIKLLNDKNIIHSIRNKKNLDEAASAYKDITVVMEEQKDLVDILVKLEPLAVIKG